MLERWLAAGAWLLIFWLPSLEVAQAAKPQSADVRDVQRSATIHWQRLPLRDAVARLEDVFDESVFLDRRIDPNQRVTLDIEAFDVEAVLATIAASRGLGVARLGSLVYLGPRKSSEFLRPLSVLRAEDVDRLPADQQASLKRSKPFHWPRFAEPRTLVTSLVQQHGWRVDGARRIPHDLWPAGGLPELSLAEQLTVLLVGFDLTFEVRPRERVLEIVPIEAATLEQLAAEAKPQADSGVTVVPPRAGKTLRETRQLFSLRVAEQPVRAVLQELSRRLDWQIEFDERAIRAAGRTADARVSFAVENVEQDELLDALLRPAGLSFRRDEQRITIVPRNSN